MSWKDVDWKSAVRDHVARWITPETSWCWRRVRGVNISTYILSGNNFAGVFNFITPGKDCFYVPTCTCLTRVTSTGLVTRVVVNSAKVGIINTETETFIVDAGQEINLDGDSPRQVFELPGWAKERLFLRPLESWKSPPAALYFPKCVSRQECICNKYVPGTEMYWQVYGSPEEPVSVRPVGILRGRPVPWFLPETNSYQILKGPYHFIMRNPKIWCRNLERDGFAEQTGTLEEQFFEIPLPPHTGLKIFVSSGLPYFALENEEELWIGTPGRK